MALALGTCKGADFLVGYARAVLAFDPHRGVLSRWRREWRQRWGRAKGTTLSLATHPELAFDTHRGMHSRWLRAWR
jgi:hypothetical protein